MHFEQISFWTLAGSETQWSLAIKLESRCRGTFLPGHLRKKIQTKALFYVITVGCVDVNKNVSLNLESFVRSLLQKLTFICIKDHNFWILVFFCMPLFEDAMFWDIFWFLEFLFLNSKSFFFFFGFLFLF